MDSLVTLFGRENISPRNRWRSYLTSGGIHAGVIALLLAIPFVRWSRMPATPPEPFERVVLLEPPHITFRAPKILPHATPPPAVTAARHLSLPPMIHQPAPGLVAKLSLPPAPAIVPERQTSLPEIAEMKVLPAPKPIVKEAKPAPERTIKIGGFGDPNGVRPSTDPSKSPVMVATLGGFDAPKGSGHAGANGFGGASIQETAFGDGASHGGHGGEGLSGQGVQVGGFGQQSAKPGTSARQAAAPPISPVVILYKPKPEYTAEAAQLHLEGEAALEVIFAASGTVRVVRVVRGLGHGLDQEAERAASEIRFRPAMRGGTAIDTTATVRIRFELT